MLSNQALFTIGRSKYLHHTCRVGANILVYRVRSKSGQMEQGQSLPFFVEGEVIKGFGRGSKELGIPTANFSPEVVSKLPAGIKTGIYYGWAQVEKSPVYKMVMSIGWNPYYNNKEKSMEAHIINKFNEDFYGEKLRLVMLGYIRPEQNFTTMEDLIETIRNDIKEAEKELEKPTNRSYATSDFFQCTHVQVK